MYRLLLFATLIGYIAVYSVKTTSAACDYDKVACPCFTQLMKDVDEDDDHPHSVLDRVVDIFEDGVDDTCHDLDVAVKCVEDATKTCDDKDTGKCEAKYEGLKVGRKLLCVDKRQVLEENTDCVNTTGFQEGIQKCDALLKGFDSETKKPPCEVLKKTADCIDDVVEKCPAISAVLDDIFDKYIQNYYHVDSSCDLDEGDDHDHDDAASISLSVSLLLVGLVTSYITVRQ
jgi:hypothetical protein